jgi:hypothetical protein
LALSVAIIPLMACGPTSDQAYGPPGPLEHFNLSSPGESLDMAYMDVKPAQPDGRVVALLHGKKFLCGSKF